MSGAPPEPATGTVETFRLPDLGEGLTSATVVSWLVAVGDEVAVDAPVAEVETAKAAVEVPIPFAGHVAELHAEAGDSVDTGAPLISIVTTPAGSADRSGTGSGNVLVGYGTTDVPRRSRRAIPPADSVGAEPDVVTPDAGTADTSGTPRRGVISPLVRRLAREQGLNVDAVEASGPNDVVTRADVDRAAGANSASSLAATAAIAPSDATAIAPSGSAAMPTSTNRVPFTPTHRAMAEALTRSRRDIPEATVWVDVDATALLEARDRLRASRPDRPVSLVGLVARFCVLGLQRFPALNGRVEGDAVVLNEAVHLGLAAQTDRGLVVPVLRDAQRLDLVSTSQAIRSLTSGARAGHLEPNDLRGGTFTLNNYGPFGVDGSAAIINPPQVAILGLGRVIERPWVVDGHITVRSITELTLAFDHRACDGGTAGGFLRFVADCMENPLSAL